MMIVWSALGGTPKAKRRKGRQIMLSRDLLHVWLLLFGCAFAESFVVSYSLTNIQNRFKGFDQVMSCLNANISSLKENKTWQANSKAQFETVS